MLFGKVDQLGNVAECHRRYCISCAVIDRHSARGLVTEHGAGEHDILNVSNALVGSLGRKDVRRGARYNLPRLVRVQHGHTSTIDVPIARSQYAVVDDQPALGGLDGNRSAADLRRLPGIDNRAHHMAVSAPKAKIGALAVEDIAERCVPVVRRPGQHGKAPVDLAWEKHPVAVERKVGVLHLVKGLKIISPGHADGGAVVPVAPRHVVAVVYADDPWVVSVNELADLGVFTGECQRLNGDLPFETVVGEAHMQLHPPCPVVAAEHSRKAALIGDNSTVEDAVRGRDQVPRYDGVLRVPPDRSGCSCRTVFPGNVRYFLLPEQLDSAHFSPALGVEPGDSCSQLYVRRLRTLSQHSAFTPFPNINPPGGRGDSRDSGAEWQPVRVLCGTSGGGMYE